MYIEAQAIHALPIIRMPQMVLHGGIKNCTLLICSFFSATFFRIMSDVVTRDLGTYATSPLDVITLLFSIVWQVQRAAWRHILRLSIRLLSMSWVDSQRAPIHEFDNDVEF